MIEFSLPFGLKGYLNVGDIFSDQLIAYIEKERDYKYKLFSHSNAQSNLSYLTNLRAQLANKSSIYDSNPMCKLFIMSEISPKGYIRLSTIPFDFKPLIDNCRNSGDDKEFNYHLMRIQSIQTGYGCLVDYSDGQVGRVDICECFDDFEQYDCSSTITNKINLNELKIGR